MADIVAAGPLAVAAVAGTAPAAGVAAGAVEEEPAAAWPLALADQVQVRELQEVQGLEGEQPWDVGGLVRDELPAHRPPGQVAAGQCVEQQGVQAGRSGDGGRAPVIGEGRDQRVQVLAEDGCGLQGLPGGARVAGRRVEQFLGRGLAEQAGAVTPAGQRGEVRQVVATPAGVQSPGDGVDQVQGDVAATTSSGTAREAFTAGIRLGAGPGAATFVLGLAYGAAARIAGWGITVPLAFSALAFSGSAQFTLLTTLKAGSAVAAAVLINARYLVMSVALNDSLHGGRLRRALQTQALVDASFVVAHRGHGRFDIARLIGASVPQWAGWVSGTAAGLLAAPSRQLMRALGADVTLPAFFLVLALDELRRSRRAIAAAGACIAAALLFVTTPGNALLAATLAATAGAIGRHTPRENHAGQQP